MNGKTVFKAIMFICLLLVASFLCIAQAGRGQGRLAGTVVDEQGCAIAGAKVRLEFKQGGLKDETLTNAKGEWAFLGLGTGSALVTANAEGYSSVSINVTVKQLERNESQKIVLKASGESKPEVAPKTAGVVSGPEMLVTKTYMLKYVTPDFIREALNMYFMDVSSSPRGNVITVVIRQKQLAAFEEQLKNLDVEKKTILLRIFTVIASKESKAETIENNDLKRVLAEVSNLLNFKSYTLDGVSAVSVKEGTRHGRLLLSSALVEALNFEFGQVSVMSDGSGKRSVKLEFSLRQTANNMVTELIQSETEIAEKGYLVAGVSRIGRDGNALVLVINAEIK